MKALISFIFIVALSSQIAFAVEFTGASLTEDEIYTLWGKNNCKLFMVNSASSKSAMPKVLANYLNSTSSFQEVKIITCNYNEIRIQHFLTKNKYNWSMFNGEAVAFLPSKTQ